MFEPRIRGHDSLESWGIQGAHFTWSILKYSTRIHPNILCCRGVARGRSWGVRDPPLVGLLLSKQPAIFRWRKRHDNILAVKAIVEKPTFLKFVFRQRLLSLVNKSLHAAIIRLSPLIHEGKQRYKPYIVGDPRMMIWWVATVTPPLKNPGYAPV